MTSTPAVAEKAKIAGRLPTRQARRPVSSTEPTRKTYVEPMKAPISVTVLPVEVRWSSSHRANELSKPSLTVSASGCVSSQPIPSTSNKMTTNAGTSRLARDTAHSLHYAPPDAPDDADAAAAGPALPRRVRFVRPRGRPRAALPRRVERGIVVGVPLGPDRAVRRG